MLKKTYFYKLHFISCKNIKYDFFNDMFHLKRICEIFKPIEKFRILNQHRKALNVKKLNLCTSHDNNY